MSLSPEQKLAKLKDELTGAFIQRDLIVTGLLVGVLAQEHVLLLGPPGTAKTSISGALGRALGGQFFEILLTRFSTTEELFGPFKLSALKDDRYERNLTGFLPSATTALVDEIFKGSSAIINALLTIMNERRFDNGGQRLTVPLEMMIGASNEPPQDDSLEALFDRFILRFWVPYISGESSFMSLLDIEGEPQVTTVLTPEDLRVLRGRVKATAVPQHIKQAIWRIKNACDKENVRISDRRWRKMLKILRANAVLSGRTMVEPGDLALGTYALAGNSEQETVIRGKITSIATELETQLRRAAMGAGQQSAPPPSAPFPGAYPGTMGNPQPGVRPSFPASSAPPSGRAPVAPPAAARSSNAPAVSGQRGAYVPGQQAPAPRQGTTGAPTVTSSGQARAVAGIPAPPPTPGAGSPQAQLYSTVMDAIARGDKGYLSSFMAQAPALAGGMPTLMNPQGQPVPFNDVLGQVALALAPPPVQMPPELHAATGGVAPMAPPNLAPPASGWGARLASMPGSKASP